MYRNRITKIFIALISLIAFSGFIAIKSGLIDTTVYSNIYSSEKGDYFVDKAGDKHIEYKTNAKWRLVDFEDIEKGVKDGILLTFKNNFEGTVLFGLFPDEPMKYSNAVFFKRHIKIEDGKAFIDIVKNLSGKYDMANWEAKNGGKIRYRILDDKNNIITNKTIAFSVDNGMFSIETSITAGPFISSMTSNSLIISFWTNREDVASLKINNKVYKSKKSKRHIFKIDGLKALSDYDYEINFDKKYFASKIKTAPKKGSESKFSFGFASDSRGGSQLGESNLKGHNAYIMRKMYALVNYLNLDFFQFTGDMIDGYNSDIEEMRLEYTNWLRTATPYMHSIPFNIGAGNHEVLMKIYGERKNFIAVDNYPFATQSSEAVFAEFFENPKNGPISEDGSKADPDKSKMDFPTYKNNVYSYIYGNTAMIVLNSNYLYTPNHKLIPQIGGNVHGYIMSNQMDWLKKEISKYEEDKDIKHVFVTIHTPAFPNGGHSNNDMWYDGDNSVRPYVAGKAAEHGIIEMRDEFMDILVNQSSKFRILLTGDEHNYTRLTINNKSKIYPEDWRGKRIKLKRDFIQIVNGAAGAPYYAKEKLPWSADLNVFSSQYALVIFHIDGDSIIIEVINPDSLETIEKYKLR